MIYKIDNLSEKKLASYEISATPIKERKNEKINPINRSESIDSGYSSQASESSKSEISKVGNDSLSDNVFLLSGEQKLSSPQDRVVENDIDINDRGEEVDGSNPQIDIDEDDVFYEAEDEMFYDTAEHEVGDESLVHKAETDAKIKVDAMQKFKNELNEIDDDTLIINADYETADRDAKMISKREKGKFSLGELMPSTEEILETDSYIKNIKKQLTGEIDDDTLIIDLDYETTDRDAKMISTREKGKFSLGEFVPSTEEIVKEDNNLKNIGEKSSMLSNLAGKAVGYITPSSGTIKNAALYGLYGAHKIASAVDSVKNAFSGITAVAHEEKFNHQKNNNENFTDKLSKIANNTSQTPMI